MDWLFDMHQYGCHCHNHTELSPFVARNTVMLYASGRFVVYIATCKCDVRVGNFRYQVDITCNLPGLCVRIIRYVRTIDNSLKTSDIIFCLTFFNLICLTSFFQLHGDLSFLKIYFCINFTFIMIHTRSSYLFIKLIDLFLHFLLQLAVIFHFYFSPSIRWFVLYIIYYVLL